MKLLSDGDLPRLNAYSQGINRYIEQCGKKLPWEFRLLRFAPEPWTAEDTFDHRQGIGVPALYRALHAAQSDSRSPQSCSMIRRNSASLLSNLSRRLRRAISRAVVRQGAELCRFTNGMLADSDWHGAGQRQQQLGGRRRRSRNPALRILCNDPHLRMTLPAMFYLDAPRGRRGKRRRWLRNLGRVDSGAALHPIGPESPHRLGDHRGAV